MMHTPVRAASWRSQVTRLSGATVTLLFTDIEGSTRLLQKLGEAEYGVALGEHRRLLSGGGRGVRGAGGRLSGG
jgi:class 3 adenylate cyclase